MCNIEIIRTYEASPLSLFEVHFDNDETPYRVIADTKEHAENQAKGIANILACFNVDPEHIHPLPK